jgi:hypothetical protein
MPLPGKPAVVYSRALQDSNGTLNTFCLFFYMQKIDFISNLNMSVRSLLISAPPIFYRNKFFD